MAVGAAVAATAAAAPLEVRGFVCVCFCWWLSEDFLSAYVPLTSRKGKWSTTDEAAGWLRGVGPF